MDRDNRWERVQKAYDMLTLGLGLERELDRHARFCQQRVREQVCLPKLWAAFQPADGANMTGDGPELATYAARTGRSPQRLLEHLLKENLEGIKQQRLANFHSLEPDSKQPTTPIQGSQCIKLNT